MAELAAPGAGNAAFCPGRSPVVRRVGAEQDAFVCAAPRGSSRHSSDCLDLRMSRGDRRGALAEIERLRTLWAAPGTALRAELFQRFALGETRAAAALYDRIVPASGRWACWRGFSPGIARRLRAYLARDVPATSDDPTGALAALTTLLGDSPAPAWEAESPLASPRTAAARRRRGPPPWCSPTASRTHFAASGLLRYTLYDLRRFSGTADVDRPDEVAPQMVSGRELRRSLRRRIFKPDGRVLDPEPRVGRQGRTDLSQLEPGDYLEEITEGFSLPPRTGRCSCRPRTCCPRAPACRRRPSRSAGPRRCPCQCLGPPAAGAARQPPAGADTVVTTYALRGAPPRRLETRTPARRPTGGRLRRHRPLGRRSGPLLGETIAALDDDDPFVARWARGPGRGPAAHRPPCADRGRRQAPWASKVKRADGSCADRRLLGPARAQRTSARAILELGDGSRTWLAYRALRELGLPAEIVVAEEEPFSADPRYPHRFGRFRHPLIVVQGSTWLDLDVRGPPLPPGRVSPQLLRPPRGRRPRPDLPGARAAAAAQATEVEHRSEARRAGDRARDLHRRPAGPGRAAHGRGAALPGRACTATSACARWCWAGCPRPPSTTSPWSRKRAPGRCRSRRAWSCPATPRPTAPPSPLPGIEPLHNIYAEPPGGHPGLHLRQAPRPRQRAVDRRGRILPPAPPGRAARRGPPAGRPPALALRAPHIEAARKIELSQDAPALDERFELVDPHRRARQARLPALRQGRRPHRRGLPDAHPRRARVRAPLSTQLARRFADGSTG